jgi:serine/threonine protein kinase
MAAPVSVDEYLELVRKSGIVEDKRLTAYLEKQRAAALPQDVARFAGLLVADGILTHFQAEQIAQGKWRRFTIGKYKVLERLGSGGMGSVFLCEHKLMRRRVALKVLPAGKAGDDAALERFYREARAVAALDHPNIVHAYDIDQEDKLHFLVMEYVDGSNLQDIVKKSGPLDPLRASHYIRQAALGLQEAHKKGLVHRDVKPGNILVDRSGCVKLLDLGLARFFNDEEDLLTKKYDENVLGTADYLAPEQAIDSHSVDIRADIYGLGATFYFLLVGRPPFGEGTVAQKLLWHQTRNPKPISEFRSDIPRELLAVINKMMAKEPKDRYSVPGDLVDALAPFTQTEIAAPPETEMPRLSPAALATGDAPSMARPASGARRALQGLGSATAAKPNPPRSATGASAGPASGPTSGSSVVPGPRRTAPPNATTPASRPAQVQAAPAPASRRRAAADAAPAEEQSPFGQLAEDTTDSAAAPEDTTPVHTGKRPRRRAEAREQRRLKIVLTAVGVPFVIAVLALAWWFYPPSAPVVPSGRPRLAVTRDTDKSNSFRTIQQALRQAQAGDIIELLDDYHEENVTIEVGPGKSPADITLQAGPGVQVVWASGRKDATEPLLRLRRALGFHLKGKGITFDGQDRVRDLISITMQSPALSIENLTLKGYQRSAIAISNAAGEKGRPLRLNQLHVLGAARDKPAVFLDANPSVESVPVNDYIEVSGLDVPGMEAAKAVQFKNDSVIGANVQMPR